MKGFVALHGHSITKAVCGCSSSRLNAITVIDDRRKMNPVACFRAAKRWTQAILSNYFATREFTYVTVPQWQSVQLKSAKLNKAQPFTTAITASAPWIVGQVCTYSYSPALPDIQGSDRVCWIEVEFCGYRRETTRTDAWPYISTMQIQDAANHLLLAHTEICNSSDQVRRCLSRVTKCLKRNP